MLYTLFLILAALPIIEIIGFITIGGDIGLLWSLLWLLTAGIVGAHLLKKGSLPARPIARGDDRAVMQAMFDNLCLLGAGLLLIFPGFISDFLALPLALAPLRHWLFQHLIRDSDVLFRNFAADGSYFTYRARRDGRAEKSETVIEGEFHRLDDKREP